MQSEWTINHFLSVLIIASTRRQLTCSYPLTRHIRRSILCMHLRWLERCGLIYTAVINESTNQLVVYLKQAAHGQPLLTNLQLFSRPGHIIPFRWHKVERLLKRDFARFYCVSTPNGLLTAAEAYSQHQAGWLLYAVW